MGHNDNHDAGIMHSLYAPHDPAVHQYFTWDGLSNVMTPYKIGGWEKETLSWKENCYLHSFLSDCCAGIQIKGPDAEKLMSDMCVNNMSIEKFKPGRAKHVICCTPAGTISAHGMCLRLAEDAFYTYFLEPDIDVKAFSGQYDIEPIAPDYGADFIFQLAGPKVLEIVENTIQQDIHDLKFMQFMPASILGYEVRVLRMGMGGSLTYEIHGAMDHLFEIYEEILRVGKPYGITRLGLLSYMCNHTENGFPQVTEHFLGDWESDPATAALYAPQEDMTAVANCSETPLYGSLAEMGRQAYYLNPIEAGWEKMIHWDHDFTGKEALKKIAADPSTRRVCTLEWNSEDVLKVFASFLDDTPGVSSQMRFPQDYERNYCGNLADKVVNEAGQWIGKSTGRVYTLYYKKVISMAFLDPTYAQIGKEVTVIWGDPGKRQIPIRAKVARYPYLDLPRNQDVDLNSIPHYQKTK